MRKIFTTIGNFCILLSILEYSGCYTLSRTLKHTLDAEIKKHERNDTFKNYHEDVRRRNEY